MTIADPGPLVEGYGLGPAGVIAAVNRDVADTAQHRPVDHRFKLATPPAGTGAEADPFFWGIISLTSPCGSVSQKLRFPSIKRRPDLRGPDGRLA
jgi:hypothetical protein